MNDCKIRGHLKLITSCEECGQVIDRATFEDSYQWISVKDKLPEMHQRIIVYLPEFYGSKDFMAMSIYVHPVSFLGATHWMPLPKPPHE